MLDLNSQASNDIAESNGKIRNSPDRSIHREVDRRASFGTLLQEARMRGGPGWTQTRRLQIEHSNNSNHCTHTLFSGLSCQTKPSNCWWRRMSLFYKGLSAYSSVQKLELNIFSPQTLTINKENSAACSLCFDFWVRSVDSVNEFNGGDPASPQPLRHFGAPLTRFGK